MLALFCLVVAAILAALALWPRLAAVQGYLIAGSLLAFELSFLLPALAAAT